MQKQDTIPINEITQLPIIFPDNLDSQFESYKPQLTQPIPFRDLPLGDYKIIRQHSFKTKDSRDCLVLDLISKDFIKYTVYTPERLKSELNLKPNITFIRNLGLKQSNKSTNSYFNYQLA